MAVTIYWKPCSSELHTDLAGTDAPVDSPMNDPPAFPYNQGWETVPVALGDGPDNVRKPQEREL